MGNVNSTAMAGLRQQLIGGSAGQNPVQGGIADTGQSARIQGLNAPPSAIPAAPANFISGMPASPVNGGINPSAGLPGQVPMQHPLGVAAPANKMPAAGTPEGWNKPGNPTKTWINKQKRMANKTQPGMQQPAMNPGSTPVQSQPRNVTEVLGPRL